jgi:hypothetical protein
MQLRCSAYDELERKMPPDMALPSDGDRRGATR